MAPGKFPKPVTDPHNRHRLWRWSEVASWFKAHRGEFLAVADEQCAAMYNAALEIRHGRCLLEPSDPVTLRELVATRPSHLPGGAAQGSGERLQQSCRERYRAPATKRRRRPKPPHRQGPIPPLCA